GGRGGGGARGWGCPGGARWGPGARRRRRRARPIYRGVISSPDPLPAALSAAAGPHILVVDDEPQIRDILASALQRDGFRVTSRGCARDALDDLRGEDGVELLLTDLKMPDMNGLDLIKEARRLDPGIWWVLTTAFASMETAVSALRGGADDYLMKPFGLDDLRRVVDRVLTERRLAGRDRHAIVAIQEEADALRQARRATEAELTQSRRDLK